MGISGIPLIIARIMRRERTDSRRPLRVAPPVCDGSSRDLARNALKLEKETTPDLVWWRRGASMALYRRKATGRRNQYPSLLLLDDVCPQPQFLLLRSSLFG